MVLPQTIPTPTASNHIETWTKNRNIFILYVLQYSEFAYLDKSPSPIVWVFGKYKAKYISHHGNIRLSFTMRNGVLSENKEVAQDDKVANKEPQVRMLKYDKKRLCNPDTFDLVPLSLSNTAAVLKCISV